MAIIHAGNTRDGRYQPICFTDLDSVAIRNGKVLGHAIRLEDGDVVVTRHPAEIAHGDIDIPLNGVYFTKGVFPACHLNGLIERIQPEEACGLLYLGGIDAKSSRLFARLDEE